jgi:hypothetical protein
MTKHGLRLTILSVMTAAAALAACGGGGAGAVDEATAEEGCQQICDHDVACGDPEDPTCVTECMDDVVGVIREDVFQDVSDCIGALECGVSDDECLVCTPTATHEEYEARCREELPACGVPVDELDSICEVSPSPDGEVGYYCLIATNIIADLTACFDEPDCNAMAACFEQVQAQVDL